MCLRLCTVTFKEDFLADSVAAEPVKFKRGLTATGRTSTDPWVPLLLDSPRPQEKKREEARLAGTGSWALLG